MGSLNPKPAEERAWASDLTVSALPDEDHLIAPNGKAADPLGRGKPPST